MIFFLKILFVPSLIPLHFSKLISWRKQLFFLWSALPLTTGKSVNFLLVFALCDKMLCPKLEEGSSPMNKESKWLFLSLYPHFSYKPCCCWLWGSHLVTSDADNTEHNGRVSHYEHPGKIRKDKRKEVAVMVNRYSIGIYLACNQLMACLGRHNIAQSGEHNFCLIT